MAKTKIEWCDKVWNPVTGCTKVSEGCRNCYAERIAGRFWGERKFTEVQCHEDKLDEPLKWKKPQRIFVNSMSDLFHPDVPDDFIAQVFETMAETPIVCRKKECDHEWSECFVLPNHTYIILTKRPDRMLKMIKTEIPFIASDKFPGSWALPERMLENEYPLENVWLGVSVEDQKTADERIPILLQTPAAVRFVSVEPMLGAIDLQRATWFANQSISKHKIPPNGVGLNWVICGPETGSHSRPAHPDWLRSVRDQCIEANVRFFFKGWGGWIETWRIENMTKWIQKARTHIDPNDVCIDMNGSICRIGKDFEKAQYPIAVMRKVSRKAAGRLLDGREWNEYPMGGSDCDGELINSQRRPARTGGM